MVRAMGGTAFLTAALLAGCSYLGVQRIEPGQTSEEVLRSAGRPTVERTLADGSKAWFYVHGPGGFTTWRVRYTADGRVADRSQVLTEENFQKTFVAGKTSERDVLDTLGPPGVVAQHPNIDDVVWTYRWMNVQQPYLLDVHFSGRTQLLTYSSTYLDQCIDLIMQCF